MPQEMNENVLPQDVYECPFMIIEHILKISFGYFAKCLKH